MASTTTTTTTVAKVDIGYLITHIGKNDPHLWLALNRLGDYHNQVVQSINATTEAGGAELPPPVIIIFDPADPNGPKITERSDRTVEINLSYKTATNATPSNFQGVDIYIEDPDLSTQQRAPLNGTRTLGSISAPSVQQSGRQVPIFYNNQDIATPVAASEIGSLTIFVPDETADRKVRIYLDSYSPSITAPFVPASVHGVAPSTITPSIVLTIPAGSPQYVTGQEFAWLITNPRVVVIPDYYNPTPTYSLQFFYDLPAELQTDPPAPLPKGLNAFGGVRIYYSYLDQSGNPQFPATDSGIDVAVAQRQGGVKSGAYNVGGGGKFWVYFVSEDNANPFHVNTIVVGLTPYVEVDIIWPPIGGDTALDITNFKIQNQRFLWQPDGSLWAEADLTWNIPSSNRYGGVSFYKTHVNGLLSAPPVNYGGPQGNSVTHLTLQVPNYPTPAEDWTITAISVDSLGKQNDNPNNPQHSPTVIWHIGPPAPGGTGQEFAPLVNITGATITTDQQISNDGVQMMRFNISGWTDPSSNQFGGVKIAMQDNVGTTLWDAGKTTSLTTPWQPAVSAQTLNFFWQSYDPQNNLNTILPGVTPEKSVPFTPSPGAIVATLLPNDFWNPQEFQWPTWPAPGGFSANVIAASKIFVGSILRVGGAPTGSGYESSFLGPNPTQQNGQVAVYSSGLDPGDVNGTPTLRAWLGQQSTQAPDRPGLTVTVYGGWFGALYVGGNGPPTSPLFVNNGGIIQVGGWDVQTQLGTTYYPYISIRTKTNLEVGRIGAHLSTGPSGNIVPPGNIADIGGAWFTQFACGGQNLADWRLLCPGDNTIRIRNINTFEIDYLINQAPVPPYNQAYQLLLGTSIAYAVNMTNYKFPGITLMRATQNPDTSLTPTTHGIKIINRGVIIGSDNFPLLGSLVTFNGDATGGDTDPFWATLTLYSNVSGLANVHLSSGGPGSGASVFDLWDDSNVQNFGVDRGGGVYFRAGLNHGNFTTWNVLIDLNGNYVGPIASTTMTPTYLTIKDNGYLQAGDGSISSPPFGAVINYQGYASFRGVSVGGSSPGTTAIDATGHVFAFGGCLVTVNSTTGTLFRVQNQASSIMMQVDGNGNAGVSGSIAAAGFSTGGRTGQTATFLLLGTDGVTYYTCHFTNGIFTF